MYKSVVKSLHNIDAMPRCRSRSWDHLTWSVIGPAPVGLVSRMFVINISNIKHASIYKQLATSLIRMQQMRCLAVNMIVFSVLHLSLCHGWGSLRVYIKSFSSDYKTVSVNEWTKLLIMRNKEAVVLLLCIISTTKSIKVSR